MLHSLAYRETSVIAELFTRDLGRVSAIAKGAKRKGSALRAVLMPFQPLTVSLIGKTELRTLTNAEWQGGLPVPQGDALICGFYLNELLLKLLPRDDAHPQLFDAYWLALTGLSADRSADQTDDLDIVLRQFEWSLLQETGYAPDLQYDTRNNAIELHREYSWKPGSGLHLEPHSARSNDGLHTIGGEAITALAMLTGEHDQGRFLAAKQLLNAPTTKMQAKRLTRNLINHILDGQKLNSRQILIDLHKL